MSYESNDEEKNHPWLGRSLGLVRAGLGSPPDSGLFLHLEVALMIPGVMLTITIQLRLLQKEIHGCAETSLLMFRLCDLRSRKRAGGMYGGMYEEWICSPAQYPAAFVGLPEFN